jgi:CheY-like chemotaxis protein
MELPEENLKPKPEKIVLIVEDEINNFLLVQEMLINEHYKSIHAWNGKEAVDLIEKRPGISLVLMDIKMPVMDGYESMRRIKKIKPWLPIVAVTAYAMSQDKEKAIQLGFDNYITKPIHRITLLKIVNGYLT